jgi:competence protein ComEC
VFLLAVCIAFASFRDHRQLSRERFWMKDSRVCAARRYDSTDNVFRGIREELSRRIGIGLEHSPETAALNRAILLGERRKLDRATKRAFIDAGTMHVFAISGLHVMVIAFMLRVLAQALFIPLRFAGPASVPFLWAYVFTVGAPPSAVRAALMASIYFASALFLRRPNALISWSVTFLAVHLHSPIMIADAGCLMSFAVTLALILAARFFSASGFRGLVTMSAAAWIASTPIAAHFFGRITPGGLAANLLLMPLASANVVCGAAGVITSFVSDTLAAHLNNLSALVASAMSRLSHMIAAIPGSSWKIRSWSAAECALWYALTALAVFAVHAFRRRRMRFGIARLRR